MGIFGALSTAVAGLRSQSYAMENISGNIANSQTVGYKRVDTSFADLVADRPRSQVLAGSVRGIGAPMITQQGEIRPTGINTNMAISGSGFFSVSRLDGIENGAAKFSPMNLFTRRGDFELDKDGYLVNGAGMFLRGDSINSEGQVTSTNGILRIDNDTLAARATETVSYSVVLPRTMATQTSTLPGEDDVSALPVTGDITGAQAQQFLSDSIAGGSINIYTSEGEAVDLQLRWAKSAENIYQLFYLRDPDAANAAVEWARLGAADFSGATPTLGPFSIASGAVVNKVTLDTDVDIQLAGDGIQRFTVQNGLTQALDIQQNGYPAGVLQDIDVTSDGRVTGIYSNGQTAPIARVAIAQFAAPNRLRYADAGAFEATADSGVPVFSPEGASVVAGSVEQSNADISEEFSRMIVTQQAYQANTRVITTAQQLMDATINMVR